MRVFAVRNATPANLSCGGVDFFFFAIMRLATDFFGGLSCLFCSKQFICQYVSFLPFLMYKLSLSLWPYSQCICCLYTLQSYRDTKSISNVLALPCWSYSIYVVLHWHCCCHNWTFARLLVVNLVVSCKNEPIGCFSSLLQPVTMYLTADKRTFFFSNNNCKPVGNVSCGDHACIAEPHAQNVQLLVLYCTTEVV